MSPGVLKGLYPLQSAVMGKNGQSLRWKNQDHWISPKKPCHLLPHQVLPTTSLPDFHCQRRAPLSGRPWGGMAGFELNEPAQNVKRYHDIRFTKKHLNWWGKMGGKKSQAFFVFSFSKTKTHSGAQSSWASHSWTYQLRMVPLKLLRSQFLLHPNVLRKKKRAIPIYINRASLSATETHCNHG